MGLHLYSKSANLPEGLVSFEMVGREPPRNLALFTAQF